MPIDSEAELEDVLSRPGEPDIHAMAVLDGDILILGCGEDGAESCQACAPGCRRQRQEEANHRGVALFPPAGAR